MATKIPSMTVVAVDASNNVLGASGTAGTEVRRRQMIMRAVSSGGKVIESDGTEGVVVANPPVAAVRIVNASNAILDSSGAASASTAIPDTVAMFVGSDNVGYGSSGSGVPVMDVHVVDETSTLLDALFGGSSGPAAWGAAATWDPGNTHANATLGGGNLTVHGSTAQGTAGSRATVGQSSGSFLVEMTFTGPNSSMYAGLGTSAFTLNHRVGIDDAVSYGVWDANGGVWFNGSKDSTIPAASVGDVLGIILVDGVTAHFYINGVFKVTETIAAGTWYPVATSNDDAAVITLNCGGTAFAYEYTLP